MPYPPGPQCARKGPRGRPGGDPRGRHDRPRLGRGEHLAHHAETERERQQVADSDRTGRRHGLIQRAIHPAQHPAAGQLGQQPVHRLIEPEQPFGGHRERDRRGDGLGRRGNPEDRVTGHRAPACRQPAQCLDMHLAAAGHQRDQSGDPLVAHVTPSRRVQPFQSCRRQPGRRTHYPASLPALALAVTLTQAL